MPNFYRIFKDLIPDPPLLVGTVAGVVTGGCFVDLPDGGTLFARGSATVGQRVFVRDGAIEGTAPSLPVTVIEI